MRNLGVQVLGASCITFWTTLVILPVVIALQHFQLLKLDPQVVERGMDFVDTAQIYNERIGKNSEDKEIQFKGSIEEFYSQQKLH